MTVLSSTGIGLSSWRLLLQISLYVGRSAGAPDFIDDITIPRDDNLVKVETEKLHMYLVPPYAMTV